MNTDTADMLDLADDIAQDGWHFSAKCVRALVAERDELKALIANRHYMAITPNVPAGFDTILGYLAKNDPDVLDQFDYYDPNATQRDGFWMMHHAGDRRVVEAPPCLRPSGIRVLNAWPLSALRERFGGGY